MRPRKALPLSAGGSSSSLSSWLYAGKAAIGVPLMLSYNAGLWLVLKKRPAYLPNDEFPFVAELEKNWKPIRAELDALLASGSAIPAFEAVEPDQGSLWRNAAKITKRFKPTQDSEQGTMDPERWRTFVFSMYGTNVEVNRAKCPETAAILDDVPNLVAAMFSVLDPGVRLPSHFGLFMGALRCHIGLLIPPGGQTALKVAGEVREWEEGKGFVFEHPRWHTAWNYSDEPRVILLLDFERPMPWAWLEKLNHRVILGLKRSRRTQATVANIEQLAGSVPSAAMPA